LEELPLTPNGKIDKKKLPAPDLRHQRAARYVAPETELQKQLAAIWFDVLGIDKIGVHDNFFELGGHSLMVTRVVALIRQSLHIELPLRLLFSEPTIKTLAGAIEQGKYSTLDTPGIVPVPRNQNLPLSFAQQRLWFLDQMGGLGGAYNMPAAMRVTGDLDLEVLNRALSEIVSRHESLRTTFSTVDGEAIQVIHEPSLFEFDIADLKYLDGTEQMQEAIQLAQEEAVKPFDLEKDIMIRGKVLQLGKADQALIVNMHHIASDGWSVPILLQELAVLYEAFRTGKPSPLSELSIQYADFSVWQRQWLQGEVLEKQIEYWNKQLAGISDVHNLPTDL
jgi:acyl carrier protein